MHETEDVDDEAVFVAVDMMLVAGAGLGAGAVRLWLINTDRVAANVMFGWPTLAMTLVPLAFVFVVFLRLDRRYRAKET